MSDALEMVAGRAAPKQQKTIQTILQTKRDTRKAAEAVEEREMRQAAKPTGLRKELYDLVGDRVPLMPQSSYKGYSKETAKRRAKTWKWCPFTNKARNDGLVLHHWREESRADEEYMFARFDEYKVTRPSFDLKEYVTHLADEQWSIMETKMLFEMYEKFSGSFILIQDRYSQWVRSLPLPLPIRTVEDLKARYYDCKRRLTRAGIDTDSLSARYRYDKKHEEKRKEQLLALASRTREQYMEEMELRSELKALRQEMREKGVSSETVAAPKKKKKLHGKKDAKNKSDKSAAAAATGAAGASKAPAPSAAGTKGGTKTGGKATASTAGKAAPAAGAPKPKARRGSKTSAAARAAATATTPKAGARAPGTPASSRHGSTSSTKDTRRGSSAGRPTVSLQSASLRKVTTAGSQKAKEFVKKSLEECGLGDPLPTSRVIPELLTLKSLLLKYHEEQNREQDLKYQVWRLRDHRSTFLKSKGLSPSSAEEGGGGGGAEADEASSPAPKRARTE